MGDHIDALLDQAIAYAEKRVGDGDAPADPSFVDFKYDFPRSQLTSYDRIARGRHDLIEMREDERGRRGMHAKRDIEAGTRLAISQPIAVHWNAETDVGRGKRAEQGGGCGNESDGLGGRIESRDTKGEGGLILRALERIKSSPSIWGGLTKLHPRGAEAASLPPWTCADDDIRLEVDGQMKGLPALSLFAPEGENEATCNEIAARLPLIVRYNAFVVETSPELFVFSDSMQNGLDLLSGVGLYGPELSYFNHSCAPNVSKFSIGDVTFLFANRDIGAGAELCHSYISHEYLCESAQTRNAILANDFRVDDNDAGARRPAKKMKGAGAETSGSIHVPPFILSRRFDPETGHLLKPRGPGRDFSCNGEYLLPIWKARILEGRGRSNAHRDDKKLGLEHALPQWESAIDFAEAHFPSLDARKIVLYVQASLCASVNAFGDWAEVATRTKGLRVGDRRKARHYADKALEMHHAIFGGWKRRFLKRYIEEFMTSHSFREQMSQAQLLHNLEDLWGLGDELFAALIESKERGKELIKRS